MSEFNPIQAVTDYEEQLKALNLNQFSDSVNINHILSIFAEMAEESEQVWQDIAEGFLLQSAEGVQLDTLGEELGITRPSEDDDEYRTRILLLSAARYFGVNRDSLVELVELISGDISPSVYKGLGRFIEVSLQGACISEQQLGQDLTNYFPVNTELLLLTKEATPFGFDGDEDALGYGTYEGLSGSAGGYTSVIYPL